MGTPRTMPTARHGNEQSTQEKNVENKKTHRMRKVRKISFTAKRIVKCPENGNLLKSKREINSIIN